MPTAAVPKALLSPAQNPGAGGQGRALLVAATPPAPAAGGCSGTASPPPGLCHRAGALGRRGLVRGGFGSARLGKDQGMVADLQMRVKNPDLAPWHAEFGRHL